jgi:hypothetical protein
MKKYLNKIKKRTYSNTKSEMIKWIVVNDPRLENLTTSEIQTNIKKIDKYWRERYEKTF